MRRAPCGFRPSAAPRPPNTLITVPTANPIWGRMRPAHTCCKSDVRAIFSGNNREAREVDGANCEQRCLVVSGSENWNTCPGVGIAARTATFRLPDVRTDDEDRQLAAARPPAQAPAAAPTDPPAWPFPPTGASASRDNAARTTSCVIAT